MEPELYTLNRELYQDPFSTFLESIGFDYYGNFETDKIGDGKVEKRLDENGDYSDEIFEIHPFCWCDVCDGENKEKKCNRYGKPNFLYKPTNFRMSWYKYPLRGNSCNREITIREFLEIIHNCQKSFFKL